MPKYGSTPNAPRTGRPGRVVNGTDRFRMATNGAGATAQVSTIQVTGVVATYAIPVTYPDGSTDTRTFAKASSDSTATLVATTLEGLIAADSVYGPLWTVTRSTDTLTLTANRKGITYTIGTVASATVVNSSTAAASAAVAYPGRAVIFSATGPMAQGLYGQNIGTHPLAAHFTALASTITGASLASGDIVTAAVIARGQRVSAGAVFDTDNDTTVTNLKTALDTALNSAFGAGTGFVATDSSGVLTVTAEVPGETFLLEAVLTAGYTGTLAVANTAQTRSNSLALALMGFTARVNPEVDTAGDEYIPAYAPLELADNHDIEVDYTGAPVPGDGLFISTVAATSGKVLGTVSTTAVWMDPAKVAFLYDEPSGDFVTTSNTSTIRVRL